MGKYAASFEFEVTESIYDLDKKLGVSFEDIINGNIGGFDNYYDLFAEYEKADSGDITVNDEYAYDGEPQFCEEDQSLFAHFYASYDIIVEANNDKEAFKKAEEAFCKADFGSYEYRDGCDSEKNVDRVITVNYIQWDTDGVDTWELPVEMEIPYYEIEGNDFDEIYENISEYISKETGFCHESFCIDGDDADYLRSLFKGLEKGNKTNEINRE